VSMRNLASAAELIRADSLSIAQSPGASSGASCPRPFRDITNQH
jgi:hypothetical protein